MSNSSLAAASALTTVTTAAFWIPAAWPLVAEMFEDQCDPEAIWAAAQKWWDVGGELDEAGRELSAVVEGFDDEDWKEDGRTNFEQLMDDYSVRITTGMVAARVIAVVMFALALMLWVLIAFMVYIAVVMLWHLRIMVFARTNPVTFATAQAAASTAAVTCFTRLDVLDRREEQAAIGMAGLLGTVMAGGTIAQMIKGNDHAWGDLLNSMKNSGDNMVWGTISRLERDLNKSFVNGQKWPHKKFGFEDKTFPKGAGPAALLPTWGGATGLLPGNITDSVRSWTGWHTT